MNRSNEKLPCCYGWSRRDPAADQILEKDATTKALAHWVHTARTTKARSLGAYCKKKQQRLSHWVHTARELQERERSLAVAGAAQREREREGGN
jgi:hypothetical protein